MGSRKPRGTPAKETRMCKTLEFNLIIVEVEQYSYDVEKSVKLSLDYLLEAPFVKASYSK